MPTGTEKKLTKIRLEYDDGTYAELTDPSEVTRWDVTTKNQAVLCFNHGMGIRPFKWVEGKLLDVDGFGFVFTGKTCDCGHVHKKRYCGHVGEDQSVCICDEPS
jgi:hypothetical protein